MAAFEVTAEGPAKLEDREFYQLYLALRATPNDKRPHLILINSYELLFCNGRELSHTMFADPHGIVASLTPDRGNILDVFSKIEYIVNVILTNFVNPGCSLQSFERLIETVELFQKIRLLVDYGILDPKLAGKFYAVKEVRNGFAHRWSAREITFGSKPITEADVFSKFKRVLEEVWKEMVRISQSIQPDPVTVISQLKSEMTEIS